MIARSTRRLGRAISLLAVLVSVSVAAGAEPPKKDVPTEADLAKIAKDKGAEIPLK